MTRDEMSRRYGIPLELLKDYEEWQPREQGRYNDADLERLNLVVTLRMVGLGLEEAKRYLELAAAGDPQELRLEMLSRLRAATLEEIHQKERQLERLDVLRRQLENQRAAGPCRKPWCGRRMIR